MTDEMGNAIREGILDGMHDLQHTQVKLLARFACNKKQAELLKAGIAGLPDVESVKESAKALYITWVTNGIDARATHEKTVRKLIDVGFTDFLALLWWEKKDRVHSCSLWIVDDGFFESVSRWRKKVLWTRFEKAKNYIRVLENIAKEYHQKTPQALGEKLFQAIRHNNLNKFMELLDQGADINYVNCNYVPYEYALYNGKIDFVKYMIEQHGFGVSKMRGKVPPLIAAIQSGNLEMVKYLVDQGANYKKKTYNGNTIIRFAINEVIGKEKDTSETLGYLLSLGLDIDEESPAHNNAFRIFPLTLAIVNGKLSLARQCLELGADPDCSYDYEDEKKTSPVLTYLCRAGQAEKVKLLLEYGADINKKDSNGETPLDNMLNMRKLTDERVADLYDSADHIGDLLDALFTNEPPSKKLDRRKTLDERREVCFELLLSAGAKTSEQLNKN